MGKSILSKILLSGMFLFPLFAMGSNPQTDGQTQEAANDSHRDEHITSKIGGQLQVIGFLGTGGLEKKATQKQNIYLLTTGNVDVNATGTTRDGMQFGGTISLSADLASVAQSQSSVLSAYLDISDKWGTVKLGSISSAAGELAIDGASSTLGGQEGGYIGCVYTGCTGANTSQCMSYDSQGGSSIYYALPELSGFTIACSYTPHNKMSGSTSKKDVDASWIASNSVNNTYPAVKNLLSCGVQYNYNGDIFHATASIVGWTGTAALWNQTGQGTKLNDLGAYQIGATGGYKDFTLGVGFLDMGTSLLNKETSPDGLQSGADAGKAYTIGASYVFGKHKVAAAHIHTVTSFGTSSKAKGNISIYTYDYNYVDGLSFYAEIDSIETQTCVQALKYNQYGDDLTAAKYKSTGLFFVVGTRMSF